MADDGKPEQSKRPLRLSIILGTAAVVVGGVWLYGAVREAQFAARKSVAHGQSFAILFTVITYEDAEGTFPPSETQDDTGRPLHSWLTLLLPYFDSKVLYDDVDLTLPWNDPVHAHVFREQVYCRLCELDDRRTADGYAPAGTAANSHFLVPGRRRRREEITDGAGQTIAVGEIWDDLPAWGQPGNVRDPSLGLNRGGETFGRETRDGAWFVFVDGSSRFLSNDIDPAVLQALATPAGGEPVDVPRDNPRER